LPAELIDHPGKLLKPFWGVGQDRNIVGVEKGVELVDALL
jgi:hypothetical protein